MAKTLIGNVKGKDGRGISKIEKTSTTGVVDTYTITYTDSTQSTYEVRNSDDIAIQRQIVPSAAVESSATASQAYAKGNYVVVNGILRKVTSAIAKGNTISDSNSTATTVCGELENFANSTSHIEPVVLFDKWDNPVNADATLTEPVSNFSRVTLSFRTNDNYIIPDVTLLNPGSKSTNVLASAAYSVPGGDLYLKTKGFTVAGTKVVTAHVGTSYALAERNLTTGETTHTDTIAVVRVIGWR